MRCYDVDSVTAASKKMLRVTVSLTVAYTVGLILSILAVIFYNNYVWVFIVGVVLACAFAFLAARTAHRIIPQDYKSSSGNIVGVYKDVKLVRGIVGGINPFGARMYDSYKKNEIRITVFIENEGDVDSYYLVGLSEKHAEYYEARGEAIHIFGAHFPVKREIDGEWLCPICGEFNREDQAEICSRCGNRILSEKKNEG